LILWIAEIMSMISANCVFCPSKCISADLFQSYLLSDDPLNR